MHIELLSIDDLELLLEKLPLSQQREGGAVVCCFDGLYDYTGKKAELVFEIHEAYETSNATRSLWVYLPGLTDIKAASLYRVHDLPNTLQSETGGEVMTVVDGNTIGVSWLFPLCKFDSCAELQYFASRVVLSAKNLLSSIVLFNKRRPLSNPASEYDIDADHQAMLEIANDPGAMDSKSPEVLIRARRGFDRLLESINPNRGCDLKAAYGDLSKALYIKTGNDADAASAVSAYREAIKCFTGERLVNSNSQINLGIVLSMRYERTMNEQYAEEAKEVLTSALKETTDHKGWANCQHRLGQLFMMQFKISGTINDSLSAETAYLRALRVFSKETNPRRWASVMHSLGNLYYHWYGNNGDNDLASKADSIYRDALAHREIAEEKALTLFGLGNLRIARYSRTGEEKYAYEAEKVLKEAIAYWEQSYVSVYSAITHKSLGDILGLRYIESKNIDDAVKAETAFRRSLELFARYKPSIEQTFAKLGLANLFRNRYDHTREVQFAKKAIEIFLQLVKEEDKKLLPFRKVLHPALCLARLYSELGEISEASQMYSIAMERARSRYIEALGYEDQIAVAGYDSLFYTEYAMFLADNGNEIGALLTADSGRAVTLGANIRRKKGVLHPGTDELISEYYSVHEHLQILEAKWQQVDARLHQMEWMSLRSELRESRARLRGLSSKLGIDTLGLNRQTLLSTSLPKDTAVVEIINNLDDARALCWRGGENIHSIPLPGLSVSALFKLYGASESEPFLKWRNALNNKESAPGEWYRAQRQIACSIHDLEPGWNILVWLRDNCTLPEAWEATEAAFAGLIESTLAMLEGILWDPIIDELGKDVLKIVLVPSGILSALPVMSAAPVDVDITLVPSIYSWLHMRETLQGRDNSDSLFFALPIYDDAVGQLPFTMLELDWVISQFTAHGTPHRVKSGNVSAQQIIEDIKNATYFHFAGHGRYNQKDPLESSLLCTGDTQQLTLQTLRSAKAFNKTQLVVLSACGTGKSSFLRINDIGLELVADEFIGFPAALIEAGAPAVIGSLWAVEDLSTAFLMDAFYRYHLDGESVDRALRHAAHWLKSAKKTELKQYIEEHCLSLNKNETQRTSTDSNSNVDRRLHEVMKWAISEIDNCLSDPPFGSPVHWAAFTCYGASW